LDLPIDVGYSEVKTSLNALMGIDSFWTYARWTANGLEGRVLTPLRALIVFGLKGYSSIPVKSTKSRLNALTGIDSFWTCLKLELMIF